MPDIQYLELIITSVVWLFLGVILFKINHPKAKLIYGYPHGFLYRVPNNEKGKSDILYYTNTIWVKNLGRAAANKVQIILNYRPEHYEIWKPVKYEDEEIKDKRFIITIDTLSPKEEVTIALLSAGGENPTLHNVKFEGGTGNLKDLQFQVQAGKAIYWLAAIMMAAGSFTLIYLLIFAIKVIFFGQINP